MLVIPFDEDALAAALDQKCFRCRSGRVVSSVYQGGKKRAIEFVGWVCMRCLRDLERQVLRELAKKSLRGGEGTMMFGYEKVPSVRQRGVFGLKKGLSMVVKLRSRGRKRRRASILQVVRWS